MGPWRAQVMQQYVDHDLDLFIARTIMRDPGVRPFTSSMTEAWRLVRFMIQKYVVELKLDMYLGVSGESWVASFYSPSRCARFEGRGPFAPLAICRAARETYANLAG
jgi:hypothetical protein